jgi:hypothetical protein
VEALKEEYLDQFQQPRENKDLLVTTKELVILQE